MRLERRALLGATAAGLSAPLYARAQSQVVEISVQYSIPEVFRALMDEVGTGFMRKNPGIRVNFRAPEQDYEAILQRNLRDAVTRQLPDVAFHGLNRQRTLAERNIPVDLRPLMQADTAIREQGYSESMLSMGQVGEAQTGIGFAISTPILYYNVDLVRRAVAIPRTCPTPGRVSASLPAPSMAARKTSTACSSTGPSRATGRGRRWCSAMAAGCSTPRSARSPLPMRTDSAGWVL
ncbi:MAG: ugpB 1 [Rubritepida sp.]|nr:ugpB 1 [Rubritepida sp.]